MTVFLRRQKKQRKKMHVFVARTPFGHYKKYNPKKLTGTGTGKLSGKVLSFTQNQLNDIAPLKLFYRHFVAL